MSDATYAFVSLDLPAALAGVLAALTCALLGNFLVLRRQALMGDAISHAVLPGIVVGFLIAGSRATWPIFLGAAGSALVAVMLIEALRRVARVEAGAAMGVGFSILFALGVLLIEQASARGVDLDAGCVLYGQLEYVNWYPVHDWGRFWTLEHITTGYQTATTTISPDTGLPILIKEGGLPRQLWMLAAVAIAAFTFVGVFYKELRLTTFDPALATALGFRAGLMHAMLMVLVASATVAAFEAVGSILVIAMLIVPAAAARVCTDRYAVQLLASLAFALAAGVLGYIAGAFAPAWVGFEGRALNVAGTMTLVAAVLLTGAIFLAPAHGVLWRGVRRRRLALSVAVEDVLAALYRGDESGDPSRVADLPASALTLKALSVLNARGEIGRAPGGGWRLHEPGRRRAASIVRRHRLWESWLVDEMGLRPDHVHETAERLEHLTSDAGALEPDLPPRALDPHQRPIPPDDDA